MTSRLDEQAVANEPCKWPKMKHKLEELGIEVGATTPWTSFTRERHSGESEFRIETTIDCITPVLVS
jgi:hypothetical protein